MISGDELTYTLKLIYILRIKLLLLLFKTTQLFYSIYHVRSANFFISLQLFFCILAIFMNCILDKIIVYSKNILQNICKKLMHATIKFYINFNQMI